MSRRIARHGRSRHFGPIRDKPLTLVQAANDMAVLKSAACTIRTARTGEWSDIGTVSCLVKFPSGE